ncbi:MULTISPECIES: hypothetical protein [Halomicrobium]|uniref:Glycosyltransferase RgtA/B/C/D-like domain-containing protein n=2 Tax=Halomicrobium mukohataei TaxID=57705 RepID=C7P0W0_HALMD|nr:MULTISPECIES: hypothetical protein [Halomicrobium]ACV48975.1 conserved hypothetical protein [Halomicrobium mukohataei DSM 12286]QCD64399.1 hypothetical protein E5139_01625 [Halomicrobium mukohataei]QFR19205.1 hypothetical protein GBQ70_01625 [Halomicrobium sp. ZPS1]
MIDRERATRLRGLSYRFLFGDRVGLLVFLGSLCLFLALWRTAFLINDSYTIANGLAAVADGSVALTEPAYGSLRSPGTNFYGGSTYSRNYGVIVLSLPVLYALGGIEAVADLPVALVALWSLLVYGTVLLAGRQFGRERLARLGGGCVVAAVFLLNVALVEPISPVPRHLLALQLLHATAAAFVGVLAFRLLAFTDSRRRGLVAAVAAVGGTPLAFWATVPKRHVVTAAVALAVAFGLVYSRDADRDWAFEARAVCYALLALLAWIHAPEALVLFVPFVLVDVPTAPDNGPRTLGVLGGVFLLALVPLFVTNTLITGDPLTVPRMLRTVSQGSDISLTGDLSSGDASGGGDTTTLPRFVLVGIGLVQSAVEPLTKLLALFRAGIHSLQTDPTDAYRTLVRSGYIEHVAERAEGTPEANLTLLESSPVLATIVAAVSTSFVATKRSIERRSLPDGVTSADAFLALAAVALTLVYIGSLPLHAQVTVRYLFPVAPILVCLAVRLPPVGRALDAHWRTVLWSWSAGVLIGGQLVLVALVALDVGRAEAFQFHAVLGLAVALALGSWSLVSVATERFDWIGAALFGLALASSTAFVGFAAIEYFGLGGAHALPMVRALADAIPLR